MQFENMINSILHGDCYQVIKNIPDNSIDLVIIDPPYEYTTGGQGKNQEGEYKALFDRKNKNRSDLEKDCNIEIITWHKSNPLPTMNNTYANDTEYCIFARQKGVELYGTYESKRKYYVTSINQIDKSKFLHPTIKPVHIIENFIINSSKENDIILDCFCGSGTTCVASKNTNRRFIGVEINKEYYDIAIKRINNEDAQGQISLFTI